MFIVRQRGAAVRQHDAPRLAALHAQVLREHGVRVLTVREILAAHTDTNMSARVDLEELASSAMTYELSPGCDVTVGQAAMR